MYTSGAALRFSCSVI